MAKWFGRLPGMYPMSQCHADLAKLITVAIGANEPIQIRLGEGAQDYSLKGCLAAATFSKCGGNGGHKKDRSVEISSPVLIEVSNVQ